MQVLDRFEKLKACQECDWVAHFCNEHAEVCPACGGEKFKTVVGRWECEVYAIGCLCGAVNRYIKFHPREES